MSRLAACCILFVLSTSDLTAQTARIPANSKIFISDMEQDLDGYIKASIVRKKLPLMVVATEEEADFIMSGSSTEQEKGKWHEGWLTAAGDKTYGTVQIVDRKNKALVWAGESGDKSFWSSKRGHGKVAEKLVSRLKKDMKF